MKIKNRLVWMGLALFLHLVILAVASISFQAPIKAVSMDGEKTESVRSYLYQEAMRKNVHAQVNKATEEVKQHPVVDKAKSAYVVKKVIQQRSKPKLNQTVASKSQAYRPATTRHGEALPALLALLHKAIQTHQQYPESAMQLERQGRVTVSFTLKPDGSIDAAKIAKSSGTDSLDAAALAAVRDAAPFAGVRDYLQEASVFSIDVVFELG